MHVCNWCSEHAMFCVEILMFNISLSLYAYMYINEALNFIFTHQ